MHSTYSINKHPFFSILTFPFTKTLPDHEILSHNLLFYISKLLVYTSLGTFTLYSFVLQSPICSPTTYTLKNVLSIYYAFWGQWLPVPQVPSVVPCMYSLKQIFFEGLLCLGPRTLNCAEHGACPQDPWSLCSMAKAHRLKHNMFSVSILLILILSILRLHSATYRKCKQNEEDNTVEKRASLNFKIYHLDLGLGNEGMGDQFTYQKYKIARKLKSVLSSFPFWEQMSKIIFIFKANVQIKILLPLIWNP